MASSINGTLLRLADKYYISYGSPEQKKIDASVGNIKKNLKIYFGNDLIKIIEFGSYKRDTILPREFDSHSDVDLMLVFNHANMLVNPGTYRTRLIRFANDKYERSEVFKDAPTVVLQLGHIKYDLVPAYEEASWLLGFNSRIFIPQSDSQWRQTDPVGFNQQLVKANTRSNSNIKKVVRLLKAWNAKSGYPLSSFDLEQKIANVFCMYCTTLQDWFFEAIRQLPLSYFGNSTANSKIEALKANADRVKVALNQNNETVALNWLSHMLPM
ncbi:MAG: SMODS domain-containing nucleotidyltransferase [Flavisolibacter sp.]